mmetsp:Transcript_22717/g.89853  ORF Transcript_22717/g.89853 Transcript_22717/m.89853 type:complete len:345 (-) Transcript_22717:912-1946(-)
MTTAPFMCRCDASSSRSCVTYVACRLPAKFLMMFRAIFRCWSTVSPLSRSFFCALFVNTSFMVEMTWPLERASSMHWSCSRKRMSSLSFLLMSASEVRMYWKPSWSLAWASWRSPSGRGGSLALSISSTVMVGWLMALVSWSTRLNLSSTSLSSGSSSSMAWLSSLSELATLCWMLSTVYTSTSRREVSCAGFCTNSFGSALSSASMPATISERSVIRLVLRDDPASFAAAAAASCCFASSSGSPTISPPRNRKRNSSIMTLTSWMMRGESATICLISSTSLRMSAGPKTMARFPAFILLCSAYSVILQRNPMMSVNVYLKQIGIILSSLLMNLILSSRLGIVS